MKPLACLLFAAVLLGCGDPDTPDPMPDQPMTETAATSTDGEWQALFDGTTTEHWRGFRKDHLPDAWRIEDDALTFVPGAGEGGDIITQDEYENFELELEWKISEGGNSGIFYNVVESDEYGAVYETGPEMQVLDNTAHSDASIIKHRAGDLYDLIESRVEAVQPVGEWNAVRIVLHNGHLEHWLNGEKIVDTEMWTPAWNAMVAASKFKDMPAFGTARRGHLALQDHGDRVWYRNIRIREL